MRTNGGGAFTTLAPRQQVTPAPYAITAGNVTGVIPSGALTGIYAGAVTLNNPANVVAGTFSGSGAGLTNVNAAALGGLTTANFWQLGGNNVSAGQFLGSTNNQPVEIWVNNRRGLRLEAGFGSSVNVIGGWSGNGVASGVNGATGGVVAGGGAGNYAGHVVTNWVGGDFDTVSGGGNNTIQGFTYYGTISGGGDNTIQPNVTSATIGGGANNTIQPGAHESVIGGGSSNIIQTNSKEATISGGDFNLIQTNATSATIGGGYTNMIQSSAAGSVIAGGSYNFIGQSASNSVISGGTSNQVAGTTPRPVTYFFNSGQAGTVSGGAGNFLALQAVGATIGGGLDNSIFFDGQFSTIAGGRDNVVQNGSVYYSTIGGGVNNTNSGTYATIPGGDQNVAGANSFAAGHRAKAVNNGAFVWADSQNANFSSTANNQFLIRAAGGVGIAGTAPLEFGFGVGGKEANAGKIGYQSFTAGSLDIVGAGTSTSNRKIQFYCEGGATFTGTISAPSDRNLKQDFQPLDGREVLAKVAALPIQNWAYKYDASKRHIGPVAQDFQAAFGLNGGDDKAITTVDADGVALAAIQGLNQKLEEELKRSREKDAEISTLKERLSRLETIFNQVTQTKKLTRYEKSPAPL